LEILFDCLYLKDGLPYDASHVPSDTREAKMKMIENRASELLFIVKHLSGQVQEYNGDDSREVGPDKEVNRVLVLSDINNSLMKERDRDRLILEDMPRIRNNISTVLRPSPSSWTPSSRNTPLIMPAEGSRTRGQKAPEPVRY
jgi:hypothetical protein